MVSVVIGNVERAGDARQTPGVVGRPPRAPTSGSTGRLAPPPPLPQASPRASVRRRLADHPFIRVIFLGLASGLFGRLMQSTPLVISARTSSVLMASGRVTTRSNRPYGRPLYRY